LGTALIPLGLLATIVAALLIARRRSLSIHLAIEVGLLLAIALFLAAHNTSPLPDVRSPPVGLVAAWARAFAVIWWVIGARLIVNVTALARRRDPRTRNARLFSDLAAAAIYITIGLIVLNSVFDLNVKGLLATSGVIAIVLGLALQNTLADVFSGIAVGLERPFQVGDQVAVGEGIEGVIAQINWRSIRVQTDNEDLATVPNSIVAKAAIINRSLPSRRRATTVEMALPASSPAGTVIELMRQATMLCEDVLASPAPSVTLRRSGLYSATYAARVFVADSSNIIAAKSSFLRQARRLLRHAGIDGQTPLSPRALLEALPPFATLSADEIAGLAETLIVRPVEPGDTVFRQGDPAHAIYVVEAGVMALSRQTGPDECASLGRIGPGDHIGELGLLADAPRAFTLEALTAGRILELPGAELARRLRANAALDAAMRRAAARGRASVDRVDAGPETSPAKPAPTILARAISLFGF
jgi:small-conductance mechanosensitive channel